MGIERIGDWSKARAMLSQAASRFERAVAAEVRQQAEGLRREIVQGLTRQAPGGSAITPPSELTLARRRLLRRGGSKSLLVRADLRNSVVVVMRGTDAFIGVPRQARGADGIGLVQIARVHEFGTNPTVIPMTPAMRRFLFLLLRRAGRTPGEGGGSGRGVVVVQVPARPFLRPAFEAFRKGLDKRLLAGVARRAGLGRTE